MPWPTAKSPATRESAVAIAARIGYPVILRQMFGSAGRGAARCDSAAAVRAALRGFAEPDAWSPHGGQRFVLQRWVAGDVVNRASVAWHGREIAGFTRGRLATHPGPLGPASVVEFAGIPAVTAATDRLFGLVGMHGLVGTQYIIETGTGVPNLIEVNRRMLPASHSGALVGIDLAAALFAVAAGDDWTGPEGPAVRSGVAPGAVPAGVVPRHGQRVAALAAHRRAVA
ncbi:MAG: hypothetical protein IPI73_11510 [Betaproteobacteria bacterium]|nr:hypothetical protein [Betaproteobacteria bacterium]